MPRCPAPIAASLLAAALVVACGGGSGSTSTGTSATPAPVPGTAVSAPTAVALVNVDARTVGSQSFSSSTRLQLRWTAPASGAVDHYRVSAVEPFGGPAQAFTAPAGDTSLTLSGLKAGTPYTVTITACGDAACGQAAAAAAVAASTAGEFWQLQGSGNTTAGLTRIVSDGNARISATRFGSEAGAVTANRIQLYYGPAGRLPPALSTAITTSVVRADDATSYLRFTSAGGSTGLVTPSPGAPLVATVATGQGVPLSAAMGGKVRLFFEAQGTDGKTRIFWVDSADAYTGQDFNSGASTSCSTAADYATGGGCAPQRAIGVEGDTVAAASRIQNARQHKLGWPTLTDWRWDGAAGTFMVFTVDRITGCSNFNTNHGYAVWDGSRWAVQYDAAGCPKLFTSAQAAFPLHTGEARYKLYYGDPSITTGRLGSGLPFLGPKKLIHGDGRVSGEAARVDFEDWESQSVARDVVFLWPNGDKLDDTAEGYIDDYHFLHPTGSAALQVMYMAITNGTEMPFGAAAILLNP